MHGRFSLLLLFAAVACSARMVRTPGSGDGARTGLVKYQLSRVASIDDDRREDADEKMRASCGGPYRIIREHQRNEGTVVNRRASPGGSVQPVVYRYIEYSCEGGAAPGQ